MSSHYNNDVAIVTGAGQGIGFEICRQLCKEGVAVVLNDMDLLLSDKAAQTLVQEGGRCKSFPGDVSNVDFIHKMIDYTVKEFGRVTLAVANAGITLFGDFFEYPESDFDKVLKLNLGGSFYLTQAASKQMIKQKSGGRVLLMSSVTGHQAHKNLAAYGMTKAALEMLAKSLVLELSPYKITINAIAPGATLTERTLSDKDFEKTWERITPIGKAASTEDIAHAALFLLSSKAGHITGQSLVIDGGWTSVSPSPYD